MAILAPIEVKVKRQRRAVKNMSRVVDLTVFCVSAGGTYTSYLYPCPDLQGQRSKIHNFNQLFLKEMIFSSNPAGSAGGAPAIYISDLCTRPKI